jgi:hypothetical protein
MGSSVWMGLLTCRKAHYAMNVAISELSLFPLEGKEEENYFLAPIK